jgi:hypothetical protein
LAFPELVYKGYNSCQGCHVSPSGGGLLTQYGRNFAAEELSTWGTARDPITPSWFNLGGDARHAYTKTNGKEAFFPMAMSMTLGIMPMKGLTGVISLGLYTRDKKTESHQAYMLYTHKVAPGHVVNMRIGKFMPHYGIMTPDHTRAIRRHHLIRSNNEPLGVEGSYVGKLGAVFFTGIMGETDLNKNLGLSYKKSFKAKQGYSARAEAYLSKSSKLGYSIMELTEGIDEKHSHAIDLTTSLGGQAYYWGQLDQSNEIYQSHELGVLVSQGLILYIGFDRAKSNTSLSGIRWFPYPHFEFQTEWKDSSFLGQLHYYF